MIASDAWTPFADRSQGKLVGNTETAQVLQVKWENYRGSFTTEEMQAYNRVMRPSLDADDLNRLLTKND